MMLRKFRGFAFLILVTLSTLALAYPKAQNPEVQARLAEVKESMARNQQSLAHYFWTQQDIISLKGEEKKEELYHVQLGPDGKPLKLPLDPNMSDEERHRQGLRGRIIEKKTEEYKEYADQMKSLMQRYVPPEKALLDQAYQRGNVSIGPEGIPNQVKLVITNYVKPQDSVTLVFDRQRKQLLDMEISSYLDDPSDAVNMNASFSSLPDGTRHISNLVLNGIKKQLTISITNTNYQQI